MNFMLSNFNALAHFWGAKALVMTSLCWSSDGTCCITTSAFSFTTSHVEATLTRCVLARCRSFCEKPLAIIAITAELSSKILRIIGKWMTCHNSKSGSPSANKAPDSATNSDSVVLRLITLCLRLPHDSRAKLDFPSKAMTKPDVDFIVLMSPAKSASQQRAKWRSSKRSLMTMNCAKSTVDENFPISWAALLSSLADHIVICLARTFTAKVMSGRDVRQSHISFMTRRAATGSSWPFTASSSGKSDPSSKWGVGATLIFFPLNPSYKEMHCLVKSLEPKISSPFTSWWSRPRTRPNSVKGSKLICFCNSFQKGEWEELLPPKVRSST